MARKLQSGPVHFFFKTMSTTKRPRRLSGAGTALPSLSMTSKNEITFEPFLASTKVSDEVLAEKVLLGNNKPCIYVVTASLVRKVSGAEVVKQDIEEVMNLLFNFGSNQPSRSARGLLSEMAGTFLSGGTHFVCCKKDAKMMGEFLLELIDRTDSLFRSNPTVELFFDNKHVAVMNTLSSCLLAISVKKRIKDMFEDMTHRMIRHIMARDAFESKFVFVPLDMELKVRHPDDSGVKEHSPQSAPSFLFTPELLEYVETHDMDEVKEEEQTILGIAQQTDSLLSPKKKRKRQEEEEEEQYDPEGESIVAGFFQ